MKITELKIGDVYPYMELNQIGYERFDGDNSIFNIDNSRSVAFMNGKWLVVGIILDAFNEDEKYQENPDVKIHSIWERKK